MKGAAVRGCAPHAAQTLRVFCSSRWEALRTNGRLGFRSFPPCEKQRRRKRMNSSGKNSEIAARAVPSNLRPWVDECRRYLTNAFWGARKCIAFKYVVGLKAAK